MPKKVERKYGYTLDFTKISTNQLKLQSKYKPNSKVRHLTLYQIFIKLATLLYLLTSHCNVSALKIFAPRVETTNILQDIQHA